MQKKGKKKIRELKAFQSDKLQSHSIKNLCASLAFEKPELFIKPDSLVLACFLSECQLGLAALQLDFKVSHVAQTEPPSLLYITQQTH